MIGYGIAIAAALVGWQAFGCSFDSRPSGAPDNLERRLIDTVIDRFHGVVPVPDTDIEGLRAVEVLLVRDPDEPLARYDGATWVEAGRVVDGECRAAYTSPLVGCTHGRYHGNWIALLWPDPIVTRLINDGIAPASGLRPCDYNGRWLMSLAAHELLHRWYSHGPLMTEIEAAVVSTLADDREAVLSMSVIDRMRGCD